MPLLHNPLTWFLLAGLVNVLWLLKPHHERSR